MKNIILSLFSVFILTLVLNCSASKVDNQHYRREWMMVSFDQFTKLQLVENKAGINLTGERTGNRVKGFATMGCNRIFFTAELKNNGKINISEIGSTEMICKNMELENAFMKKIGNMKNYLTEGHRLTLSDNNGNEMKFIAADWD
jgi:heat shock protein HslJ